MLDFLYKIVTKTIRFLSKILQKINNKRINSKKNIFINNNMCYNLDNEKKKIHNDLRKNDITKEVCFMYNAIDIARWVISKCNKDGKKITNLRLQKTLYYIQGYFIRRYKYCAYNSQIYNWPYGPVVPDVYYEFCVNGSKPIYLSDNEELDPTVIRNREHRKIIDCIVDKCFDYTTSDLVSKTHEEKPWLSTCRNEEMTEEIDAFFTCNDPLGIENDG